jgi:hypothetical protein
MPLENYWLEYDKLFKIYGALDLFLRKITIDV